MPRQITLNAFDSRATLEVTVRISRRFRVRLWLARHLMRLAAWLLGTCYVFTRVDPQGVSAAAPAADPIKLEPCQACRGKGDGCHVCCGTGYLRVWNTTKEDPTE